MSKPSAGQTAGPGPCSLSFPFLSSLPGVHSITVAQQKKVGSICLLESIAHAAVPIVGTASSISVSVAVTSLLLSPLEILHHHAKRVLPRRQDPQTVSHMRFLSVIMSRLCVCLSVLLQRVCHHCRPCGGNVRPALTGGVLLPSVAAVSTL